LVTSLLRTGVLDELRLIVHPVALGSGMALFGGISERQELELVAAEPWAAGRVVLTYRPGSLSASDR
jgi:dihydrofolate reductase